MSPYPKFSIVIPTFNKVKYITQTFDSIFSQKYPNLEVIVQDGGSTDGTLEVIRKYTNKYPIICESKKDEGQCDAIRKGFKKATGDIYAFINADDYYEKDTFEKVGDCFAENPDLLWLAGRSRVVDTDGKEVAKLVTLYKNLLLSINKYPLLISVNYLMQPSIFLSKKCFQKYGPFLGTRHFMREYENWLKIGRNKMPLILPEILSNYRVDSEAISSKKSLEILEDDINIVKRYTSNKFLIFLRRVNNTLRLLVARVLKLI